MLTIADSADYAALGEELNFWQLMVSLVWLSCCMQRFSAALIWCSYGVAVVSSCPHHLQLPMALFAGSLAWQQHQVPGRKLPMQMVTGVALPQRLCKACSAIPLPLVPAPSEAFWLLSWCALQARFQVTGDVLLGYYEIPETVDIPLNTVINPSGEVCPYY